MNAEARPFRRVKRTTWSTPCARATSTGAVRWSRRRPPAPRPGRRRGWSAGWRASVSGSEASSFRQGIWTMSFMLVRTLARVSGTVAQGPTRRLIRLRGALDRGPPRGVAAELHRRCRGSAGASLVEALYAVRAAPRRALSARPAALRCSGPGRCRRARRNVVVDPPFPATRARASSGSSAATRATAPPRPRNRRRARSSSSGRGSSWRWRWMRWPRLERRRAHAASPRGSSGYSRVMGPRTTRNRRSRRHPQRALARCGAAARRRAHGHRAPPAGGRARGGPRSPDSQAHRRPARSRRAASSSAWHPRQGRDGLVAAPRSRAGRHRSGEEAQRVRGLASAPRVQVEHQQGPIDEQRQDGRRLGRLAASASGRQGAQRRSTRHGRRRAIADRPARSPGSSRFARR